MQKSPGLISGTHICSSANKSIFVRCGEIHNTVIIKYETLSDENLVRTRRMFGRFYEFFNFGKVQN
jgi:hypothetical protein